MAFFNQFLISFPTVLTSKNVFIFVTDNINVQNIYLNSFNMFFLPIMNTAFTISLFIC